MRQLCFPAREIKVPGNRELQGYGILIYLDKEHPFLANPPFIPNDYNPVGSYRTAFTVPQAWPGRQVYLHFGSIRFAMYVWVNGKKIGHAQGGTVLVKFNICKKAGMFSLQKFIAGVRAAI